METGGWRQREQRREASMGKYGRMWRCNNQSSCVPTWLSKHGWEPKSGNIVCYGGNRMQSHVSFAVRRVCKHWKEPSPVDAENVWKRPSTQKWKTDQHPLAPLTKILTSLPLLREIAHDHTRKYVFLGFLTSAISHRDCNKFRSENSIWKCQKIHQGKFVKNILECVTANYPSSKICHNSFFVD